MKEKDHLTGAAHTTSFSLLPDVIGGYLHDPLLTVNENLLEGKDHLSSSHISKELWKKY